MRKPIAVSDLLKEGQTRLKRLNSGAEAASQALVAVQHALPGELSGHVFGVLLEGGRLTVVVDSGAWATRVRYALADLVPAVGQALGAEIASVRVQVRPKPD
jgi:hypothetical protein